MRKAAQEAKRAGVRLVACGRALQRFDIDPSKLQPQSEVVAKAVAGLSRRVAEGYQVIRYQGCFRPHRPWSTVSLCWRIPADAVPPPVRAEPAR